MEVHIYCEGGDLQVTGIKINKNAIPKHPQEWLADTTTIIPQQICALDDLPSITHASAVRMCPLKVLLIRTLIEQ
jgi:hypothetical protein